MLLRTIKSMLRSRSPADLGKQMQDAANAFGHRDYAGCADKLEFYLNGGGEEDAAYRLLAQCYGHLGKYVQAINTYRIITEKMPTHVHSWGELGRLLYIAGEREQSIEIYKRCLMLEGLSAEAPFDQLYLNAINRTGSCPFPLKRRGRRKCLVDVLETVRHVPGEVAECGCFRGLSSYLLCSVMAQWERNFQGDTFHIFDSFEGLSKPTEYDVEPSGYTTRMCAEGSFRASLDLVQNNLSDFPDIAYHPGWIPDSFDGIQERSYRFIHVDVDLYAPTLASFQYFFPRLAPGGVIITDDYNWPGAKQAVEEFSREWGVSYSVTPSNQAYFVKNTQAD